MGIQCGQTNTPSTENDALPCDEFRSTKCSVHEIAISYLGLPANSTLEEVIEAMMLSLIDARNRIEILETP